MRATMDESVRSSKRDWRQAARGSAAGLLLLVALLPCCRGGVVMGQTMKLTTTSFQGSQIPEKFTCNGAGISPELSWSEPPAGTASFALIVADPDAPGRTFVHWVLYDMPAGTRALREGLPYQGQLPDGARQGRNDFGNIGYGGPCPPGHSTHHYVFTLYALDIKLNLPAGASQSQVESDMKGHILAQGELTGLYKQ